MRLLFEGGFYSRAAFIGEFTVYGIVCCEMSRFAATAANLDMPKKSTLPEHVKYALATSHRQETSTTCSEVAMDWQQSLEKPLVVCSDRERWPPSVCMYCSSCCRNKLLRFDCI